ncbi:MAG: histidine kinase [Flavobacteriales bacterium]|nr:histidine kinase [Flavobacteriales bacterium]
MYRAFLEKAKRGDSDQEEVEKIIKTAESIDYVEIVVKCKLSQINKFMDNGPRTHKALDLILPTLKPIKNSNLWLDYYYFRTMAFIGSDDLEKAMTVALLGLQMADSVKDQENRNYFYSLLGNINGEMRDYEKSIFYYSKVYDYFEAKEDSAGLFQVCQNVGIAFALNSQYDSAKYYFEKSLRIFEENDLSFYTRNLISLVQLGKIYLAKNQLDSAEYCLTQFENYYRLNPDAVYQSTVAFDNWEALTSLYIAKKQWEKAKRYLRLAKDICDSLNALECSQTILGHEITIALTAKNDEKLIKKIHEYITLSDGIYEQKRVEETVKMQEKYESIEKDREILKLENQNQQNLIISERRKNTITIVIAIGLLVIAITGAIVIRNRSLMNKKLQRLKNQALQLQINPHFFFNAMNSIGAYVSKSNPKEAKYYLTKFARLMRLTLENAQDEFVEVGKELEMLENYIILEKVRKDIFDYKIEFPAEIEELKIPSLMLQPFVENAIKHGFAYQESPAKGLIKIGVTPIGDHNTVKVIIEDNGIGFNSQSQSPKRGHKSMALKILQERLDNYQMSKKGLLFENTDDADGIPFGTRVTFYLPLISN